MNLKINTKAKDFYNALAAKIFGGSLIFLSSFLTIALLSYSMLDPSLNRVTTASPHNWFGVFGSYTADLLLQLFGFASSLFAATFLSWGVQTIMGQKIRFLWLRFISLLLTIAIADLILAKYMNYHEVSFVSYGGALGMIFSIYSVGFEHKYLFYGIVFIFILTTYFALAVPLKFWYNSAIILAKSLYRSLVFMFRIAQKLLNKHMPVVQQNTPFQYAGVVEEIAPTATEIPINRPEVLELEKVKPLDKVTAPKTIKSAYYQLPTSDLLNIFKKSKGSFSEVELRGKASDLIKVLNDFGVRGEITNCSPGPVVTLFEFEPVAGTKSSRIIGLADDIARTMRATSTRISVIPGKNSLGIELPNQTREMVYIRELVESKDYLNNTHKLPLILGKDISGNNVVADLTEMPHLLVAGTTGSGKSVAINTMILSLLYKHTPDECKLVMIDPKMLELSIYQNIPHLLAPVVTEPSKAVSALKWVVKEMENRYRLISHLKVRNIANYNEKIEEAIAKNINLSQEVQTGVDPDTREPIYEKIAIEKKKLPYIVVIVDEMADLMIVAGKEIESSIQRLAQMARAAGIHLIMATQRPSVDVITGVIKANFPTRISFHVISKIDSRTILGDPGAEQLLGKGDMLFMFGGNRIRRVHGPFVEDGEVEKVVSFWKKQSEPVYLEDITTDNNATSGGGINANEKDELYDQAMDLVMRERKVSTSYLQRYFKIGYNRAATIVEQLEKNGVVGAPNHVGKRDILVNE
jgi:DNA segregation ATPase FtsK/SpoIIIE, S-DNA-T family